MKVRKNPKVNLENKRRIFFQIGMITALIAVFAAFEYRTYEKDEIPVFSSRDLSMVEDYVLPTIQKPPPPPEPVKPQPIKINIIDDNKEIDLPDIVIDIFTDEKATFEELPIVMDEPDIVEDIIFSPAGVEKKPEFPGGYSALMNYLKQNMKYPRIAKEMNITGIVYLNFVVEKDGTTSNITVLRGVGGGCTEEAIKAVENMPAWIPGSQWGKTVRCSFNLPVKFHLQ